MKTGRTGKKVLMTASVYVHIRNFHLPYLHRFQELGWETHVGCAGIPGDAPFIDKSIELPFEKRFSASGNFHAMKMLHHIIQAEHYDLIIMHTTLASFFTRYAIKGLKTQLRTVCVMHGYLFDDDTPALKRRILLGAEQLTVPETDLLLTMNQWDYDFAVRRRLARRVEKIPGMGVDFTKLDCVTDSKETLRDRLGFPRDVFLLLYAAEFSNRKSQSVLIEAMTALPERALLLLAGDGGQLDACKARARELGLGDRVRFLGHVADVAPLYRASDVCVSASRSEGLPFNVMEAMHAGLPVVASRVKGHTDLIEDGVNGMLYEYGNAGDCAEKLRRLMDDPALRQALSTAARARAEAYRLETVLPGVMDRYLSVLDGGSRRVGFTDLRESGADK